MSEAGESRPTVLVNVEERVRLQEVMLLPYIFFEENSSEIPSRYDRSLPENRATDPISLYHGILPLLGERMTKAPEERIKLIGTNAGTGAEAGNLDLARARAQAVKEYLVTRWNVAPDRIELQARGLPEHPSNPAYPAGMAENRRVEIVASDRLLGPVAVGDTLRRITSPGVRFRPEVEAEAGIASWMVEAQIDGRTIRRLRGDNLVKPVIDDQLTDDELNRINRSQSGITYTLTATDSAGQKFVTTSRAIPVEFHRTRTDDLMLADSLVTMRDAIVFDFNNSSLRAGAKAILARLRERVPANAVAEIKGYADETGDSVVNQRLSLARARTAAAELSGVRTRIDGMGDTPPPYPNDTPEGRFYSRTVRITVKTEG